MQIRTASIYLTLMRSSCLRCGQIQNTHIICMLFALKIETSLHYPTPLPYLPAYKYLNHSPADFPVATLLQKEILSLPMYAEMTEEMSVFVADKIREFYKK